MNREEAKKRRKDPLPPTTDLLYHPPLVPTKTYTHRGGDREQTRADVRTRGPETGHAVEPALETPEDTAVEVPGRSAAFAARLDALLRAYRLYGHLVADIDPLDRPRRPSDYNEEFYNPDEPELDPAEYGIRDEDFDVEVICEPLFGPDQRVTVRQVIDRAKERYCDTIGVEYQDIPMTRPRTWLQEQIEQKQYAELDGDAERQRILRKLVEADTFESFLHRKYIGAKRFSVTGADSMIPMFDAMLEELGESGASELVFGMAHRGRLNVLHNIMGKPAEMMLSEFEKEPDPEEHLGSSDVKYHMGYSSDYTTRSDHNLHLSLCFNPSHLEYVNPVVMGRTRAKQRRSGLPEAREAIVPLLIHGDAAFAGQGIASEALNLSRIKGYSVGGTIHLVVNNQIGFTTEPEHGRSTTYATDVARTLEVPIFHVNGNDPEACVRAIKLASRYRQRFQDDVVIDLVCYREYGHNEGDEPRFTQPEMYERIDNATPVHELYANRLQQDGIIAEGDIDDYRSNISDRYNDAYEEIQDEPRSTAPSSPGGIWSDFRGGDVTDVREVDTTVEADRLTELGQKLVDVPDDFTPHRTIGRLLDNRAEMVDGERPINWGFAEALAAASLLDEGVPYRLAGQDSVRGTFSHRHAALFDNETGEAYWPHRHLSDDQGSYTVLNSMLSEAGVLGFEYGYSLDTPDGFTCWEAQFGDFVNGAQVIIDQFINSGEDKWNRLSGLTMLLPHGYEGQGPEHSSARLERFLELSAEHNMFVVNPTLPSQFFHLIRRQVHAEVRKPLIVMTPKSLLRHEECVSQMSDLAEGSFDWIIPDARDGLDEDNVRRVVLCTGKVYYDLLEHARENDIDDVALVRVEQLYPLDTEKLQEIVDRYGTDDIVWTQEEPKNMGPWPFMLRRLISTFDADPLPRFVGRQPSASPATGSKAAHEYEQTRLIERTFDEDGPEAI